MADAGIEHGDDEDAYGEERAEFGGHGLISREMANAPAKSVASAFALSPIEKPRRCLQGFVALINGYTLVPASRLLPQL
jgi:hypothetical protein